MLFASGTVSERCLTTGGSRRRFKLLASAGQEQPCSLPLSGLITIETPSNAAPSPLALKSSRKKASRDAAAKRRAEERSAFRRWTAWHWRITLRSSALRNQGQRRSRDAVL